MRRWRLKWDTRGPALAHCWQYGEIASPWDAIDVKLVGKPLCGKTPIGNWRDWAPGDYWCRGFCKGCAKAQQPPQSGQSGTTR